MVEKNLDGDTTFKMFCKSIKEIKEITETWDQELELKELDGYTKKHIVKREYEALRMKNLDYLKASGRTFTAVREIHIFMKSVTESKEKNKCFYTEVLYKNNSSIPLKHSGSVSFKLEKDTITLAQMNLQKTLRSILVMPGRDLTSPFFTTET